MANRYTRAELVFNGDEGDRYELRVDHSESGGFSGNVSHSNDIANDGTEKDVDTGPTSGLAQAILLVNRDTTNDLLYGFVSGNLNGKLEPGEFTLVHPSGGELYVEGSGGTVTYESISVL